MWSLGRTSNLSLHSENLPHSIVPDFDSVLSLNREMHKYKQCSVHFTIENLNIWIDDFQVPDSNINVSLTMTEHEKSWGLTSRLESMSAWSCFSWFWLCSTRSWLSATSSRSRSLASAAVIFASLAWVTRCMQCVRTWSNAHCNHHGLELISQWATSYGMPAIMKDDEEKERTD